MMDRATQYPHHLAKLVAARLRADAGRSPPETVLCRLLETLYFASLKTHQGQSVLCTVDYVDPQVVDARPPVRGPANRRTCVRFDPPLPLEVRTLTKLGGAADPTVASLAVFSDSKHRLFIWGMIDQEPRYGDEIALEPAADRPGLFRATILGPGNISVSCGGSLVGSLVQNALVEEYHNVLWSGPVHAILKQNLEAHLALRFPGGEQSGASGWERELLLRWINSVCRILIEVQRYRHGGGLVVLAQETSEDVIVNYALRYDRLLAALVGLVQSHFVHRYLDAGHETARSQTELASRKKEVLGAIRLIASLCGADGVVLLDKGLGVHGFGAELRAVTPIGGVFLAGDAAATVAGLRRVDLTHFGTRHRAMIRYCDAHPGALGLVVSQDGEIQAMTRIAQRLVLWENVDVGLGMRGEG